MKEYLVDVHASFEYTSCSLILRYENGNLDDSLLQTTHSSLILIFIFFKRNITMQLVVWTLIGLIAYICGLVIVLTMTPRLGKFRYDDWMFLGYAVAVVSGGILLFVPLAITFAVFNGTFGVKIFDFLLLVGIFIIGLMM